MREGGREARRQNLDELLATHDAGALLDLELGHVSGLEAGLVRHLPPASRQRLVMVPPLPTHPLPFCLRTRAVQGAVCHREQGVPRTGCATNRVCHRPPLLHGHAKDATQQHAQQHAPSALATQLPHAWRHLLNVSGHCFAPWPLQHACAFRIPPTLSPPILCLSQSSRARPSHSGWDSACTASECIRKPRQANKEAARSASG